MSSALTPPSKTATVSFPLENFLIHHDREKGKKNLNYGKVDALVRFLQRNRNSRKHI